MTGSGTESDPFLLYNIDDFQAIQNAPSAWYKLNNSIDATPTHSWNWNATRGVYEGFVPITSFSGHLDGQLFNIIGLYMNRAHSADTSLCIGTFDNITGNIEIKNLFILEIEYYFYKTGAGTLYGGGLAGNNNSFYAPRNVYISGSIYAEWAAGGYTNGVGGMFGAAHYSGGAGYCAADVDVEFRDTGSYGGVYVGGFVGFHNGGSIFDCFARGPVYGYSVATNPARVGGFVGRCYQASFARAYSTGYCNSNALGATGGFAGSNYQGTQSYCYWDIETSGRTWSALGTGKTTAQMKTESTYVTWDFDTIWAIDDGINDGYPYLLWVLDVLPIAITAGITSLTTISAIILGEIIEDSGIGCDGRFRWRIVGGSYIYTDWCEDLEVPDIYGYQLSSLEAAITYEFSAQAQNAYGIGPWSAPYFFMTIAPHESEPELQGRTSLEAIRNVEMATMGSFYIDREGTAIYKSRFGRSS